MVIVGDDTKATLQGLVRTQQIFRQNVYHYIINGMTNMNSSFQVLAPSETTPEPPPTGDTAMQDSN